MIEILIKELPRRAVFFVPRLKMFASEQFEIAKVLPFGYSKLLWQNQKKRLSEVGVKIKNIFTAIGQCFVYITEVIFL